MSNGYDVNEIYVVGWEESEMGYEFNKMKLMKGNELLVVDGVMFYDEEGLDSSWEDNMEMMLGGEVGIMLINISDEDVKKYYGRRIN